MIVLRNNLGRELTAREVNTLVSVEMVLRDGFGFPVHTVTVSADNEDSSRVFGVMLSFVREEELDDIAE